MIAILSDDKKQDIGKRIYEEIKSKDMDVDYISTGGLDIKPCYSCGYCSTKTYGKCAINDDMDAILRRLIKADKMILVTPIIWGSYSSDIKKVLDRTAVIGDTHYYVVKGELVKGMRSSIKRMFAIGVKNDCSEEEKTTFEKLLHENVRIMNISGKAFVVNDDSEISAVLGEICR